MQSYAQHRSYSEREWYLIALKERGSTTHLNLEIIQPISTNYILLKENLSERAFKRAKVLVKAKLKITVMKEQLLFLQTLQLELEVAGGAVENHFANNLSTRSDAT